MRKIIPGILAGLFVAGLFSATPAGAQEDQVTEPLLDVASEMNSAAVQLEKLHTGKPTQDAQQAALKKLDLLIAELEKKAKEGGNNVNPKPTKPANESTIRQGPGGMGDLHAARREGKQWGDLPAKERERILQSLNDGFPSHYQKILERYFARLADEKPFNETESTATETQAPAKPATPSAETKPVQQKEEK